MYDKHDDQYIRADSHLCEGCNEVLTISIETIMASTSLHDESHLDCPPPPPAEGKFVQIGQDGSEVREWRIWTKHNVKTSTIESI